MAGIIPLGYQTGVYDNALMGILQNCVKLPQFLDVVFSFLARRTDFYLIMEHERAKMGFPVGVAEGMVMQAFKKYEVLTRKREAEIQHEKETKRLESLDEPEVHIQDELPVTLPQSAKDPPASSSSPSSSSPPSSASSSSKRSSSSAAKKKKGAPALSKEKVEDWEKVSDTFNGAQMENYKWSQSIYDIDVKVPLPEKTKARDVKVDIRSDYLKVELIRPTKKVLINKPLLHKIKVQESMWNLDKERSLLNINLEKTKEIMWKSVLEGEEGIDLTKVDTTRDISEFDPECQAAIQKVTYDEHMKRLGKPTSSQRRAHEMLRKAWNAEGSPFKGTPFDPSRVQITGDF